MGKGNFTEEFKRDAVAQITERGYPVAEVSERLGVSPHSLYQWKRKFAKTLGSGGDDKDAEIRGLKRELARGGGSRPSVTCRGLAAALHLAIQVKDKSDLENSRFTLKQLPSLTIS